MKSNECLIVFECHACGNKARQEECKYFEIGCDGFCKFMGEGISDCQCDEAKKDVLNEELKLRVEQVRQCLKCGGSGVMLAKNSSSSVEDLCDECKGCGVVVE